MKPVDLTAVEHLTGGERGVERTVGGNRLAQIERDGARVARLDRHDRGCREQHLGRLDVRRLAEIGVHAGVLEHERRLGEFGLMLGDALEVELRLLGRLAAEGALEQLDVGVLIGDHGVQELLELMMLDAASSVSSVIERGLQVLQREGVVENANVALAERARRTAGSQRRARNQGAQDGAAAEGSAAGHGALAQERHPGVTSGLLGRFTNCAIGIDGVEIHLHVLPPLVGGEHSTH